MASWNDIHEGNKPCKCPVCLCELNKKKFTRHVNDCYANKKAQMDTLGVIQCPFDPLHILPITFLNHHLDGNCQGAQNLLRKFFQDERLIKDFRGAPPDFKADYPEKYLNSHNKDLLYLLQQDMYGLFIENQQKDNNQGASS